MDTSKKDLLEDCITDLSPQERDYRAFQETFCARCRNPNCVHAQWVADRFSARVAAQPDRMFRPRQLDPKDPRFAHLKNFVDMFQEAMRLEISDRKGDWTVPEVPVLDGRPQVARVGVTSTVDEAVQALARAKGKEVSLPDPRPAQAEEFVEETQHLMAKEEFPCAVEEAPVAPPPQAEPPPPPPVLVQNNAVVPLPGRANTPNRGGIVIGGGPAPTLPVAPDPWAPKEAVKVVPPGAKIRLGGDKPDEPE